MKNTSLPREQVKKVAEMAKLSISCEELKKLAKQLSQTINYIKILGKIRLNNISPTAQVSGLSNITREDKTGKCLRLKDYFRTKSIF